MREKARAWILANPTATIGETMKNTGASQGVVSDLRRELVQAGLVPPYLRGGGKGRKPTMGLKDPVLTPENAPLTTEELMRQQREEFENRVIEGLEPLSREERKKKLEAIVRAGTAEQIIRANEAIEKMDQRDGVKEEIGSPAPETLEEAIDDVTDVVEALMAWGGEDAVRIAMTRGIERFYEAQTFITPTIVAQPDLLGGKEA